MFGAKGVPFSRKSKKYSRSGFLLIQLDLLKGQRLSDLKYLARAIPEMHLGIVYNNPVLTLGQARELLDKEVEIISKGYETIFGLGLNSHMWRGGVVKRLARDQCGDEIVDKFDEIGVNDYIDYLKSKGYEQEESYRDPDYIRKERHLLAFFKQGYSKNPNTAVENFRKWYTNNEPKLEIFSIARNVDASKIGKIKLPPKSRLFSFGITEHMHEATPYSNDLSIDRTTPSSDSVHFWSRTSLDSPILLPLQEYACNEVGISFR